MIRPFARLYRCALPLAVVTLCNLAPSTLLANTHAAHIQSQSGNASTAQAARESASVRTLELLTLHKRWLKAPASERAQLHQQLLAKAEQRRQLLDELMQSHPAEVLRVAIPEDKQRGLPPEVVAKLEQRLELEGELEVLYEDYPDGSAKLRHVLKTPFGERFELHFAQAQRQWRSGLHVRAQGWLLERVTSSSTQGDIALSDDDNGLILLAGGDAGMDSSSVAYAMPNTLGAQRTLAILVNFEDAPSNKPWTLSQANSLVFGSVSDFFSENSSQQTWLTGSVAGWYTLPLSSTTCDGSAIELHGKQAAQAAGYSLDQYDRFILIFPQNSACGYAGAGQVGAFPSVTWINGYLDVHTLGHELGHNLGLWHAHALDCGDTTLGSSCTSQAYGDTLDVMGYFGTVGHFNAFNKERLGWLATSNITEVTSSGSFYLQPASAQTSSAKLLKIPRGLNTSGAPSYYYVEFRQPIGIDAQLTDLGIIDPNNVFNGVAVRQASPSDGNSGYLLDMTAGSNRPDMMDAALTAGRSFSDGSAGVSISTQWTDASQALVSVDLSGSSTPTCTRNAPMVSVSPGQSTWLAAGGSFSYTVSVTNKDSSACSSSSFSLSPVKPSGWSASLGSASLSLAPGASANTTLKITAPSSATDGFYTVGSSASANGLSASGTATFVVSNPTSATNQTPIAVNDGALLSSIGAVNVPVLANDSDPDGDKLSIVAFTQGSKGSVSLNSDGTLRYSPAKAFKSSDQFSYTISDGKSSASATVSIGLQSSSSGGSTGGKGSGKGH